MVRLTSNGKFIDVAKKFVLFYYDKNLQLKSKIVNVSKLKQLYEKCIVVGVYVLGRLFMVEGLKDVTLSLKEFSKNLLGYIPQRQFKGFCKISEYIGKNEEIFNALQI